MKKMIFMLLCGISLYASDIVLDKDTDLMWQDNYDAKSVKKSYSDAVSYCKNLVLDGYSDWRLPNIDELMSITDKSKHKPAIKSIFTNVKSDYYWTITKTKWNSSRAWLVDFDYGDDYNDLLSFKLCVRCVR